ncbi:MAG: helix-turn-helix domain-containing protein, partial [Nitrospirae bacterium]|nr:helix-turn-helix domain-containing protein [Nitrospirota bacterium]
DHGKRGLGNIVIYDRYGKDRRKLLKCKTCNFRFSERRSTFFFGFHTKESKIKEVILYLLKGMSFREAATASELDKDTVQRIWKRFVLYCEESMDSLLKEFNIKLEDLIMLLYNRTQKRVR